MVFLIANLLLLLLFLIANLLLILFLLIANLLLLLLLLIVNLLLLLLLLIVNLLLLLLGTMADIYDSARWKRIMGEKDPGDVVDRIGVHYCVDAVPSFGRKECHSVKPVQLFMASLAPWLRYKAHNMIVQMLVPASLKGYQAKKYYSWAAHYEMNDLHISGVDGVRVVLYGVTLDTPGRRELLGLQSSTAFYPCPHCLHTWQPGLRGQVYGGYRRFLSRQSRFREKSFLYKGNTYWFRDVETRLSPMRRSSKTASAMISLATKSRPFCGHKVWGSFLDEWVGADWEGHSCDPMHDMARLAEMFLKGLVGKLTTGWYKSWKHDSSHRDDCEAFEIFPEFCTGVNPVPPWRLTSTSLYIADSRVRRMWWPHYMDKLCRHGHSFFTHSDRMFKCRHKHYVFTVLLPTCLHGFVPAVHQALLTVVFALRRLAGQAISIAEAARRGVLPGSNVITVELIPHVKDELIFGLVLLEGSFPVAHLNPALHHFIHYGDQTEEMGILNWMSMYSFERNNKKIKGLVRNSSKPLSSLANHLKLDIVTKLLSMSDTDQFKQPATCVLSSPSKYYRRVSRRERFDLSLLGVSNIRRVRQFKVARILQVHFSAGEWGQKRGQKRCGSVISTTYGMRTRYCIVSTFLRVEGKSFARVSWLSIPEYPYYPNPLVVRVRLGDENMQNRHRCVIPVEEIDPVQVGVIPHADGVHFWMVRTKGWDTVPRQ